MRAQITYRGLPTSSALNELVQKKVEKLATFSDRMTGCQVVIEAPHRHRHKGWLYRVRVRLSVDGQELIAKSEVPKQTMHEDAQVAVRQAFQVAVRQLKALGRRRSSERPRPMAPEVALGAEPVALGA